MDRRTFLQAAALCAGGALPLLRATDAHAASDLKITRIRVFNPADFTPPIGTAAVIHSVLPFPGVVVDTSRVNQIAEFTEPAPASLYQGESLHRPDGSHLYL